ncbi:MAG TPA: hypothetical protein VJ717_04685 [Gemmatimonadaceae bacterium]|nr:hypothetical protein [Gemmatimonadaceae bacterium]
MRFARDFAILTALMALGTWLLGWWCVPLVAAAAAIWARSRRGVILKATLAGACAWVILLVVQELFGSSVTRFGSDLGVSLGVPAALPLAMTIILPGILAASAAATVVAIAGLRRTARL